MDKQTILNHIYEYDSFLDGIRTVAEMGCGSGEAITWWANLKSRDEPAEPHNYKCYAVDPSASRLNDIPDQENIIKLTRDFTERCLPVPVDFIFSYDTLQHSINPLETLKIWNEQMNVNGMLMLTVKQHSGVEFNRYQSRTYSGSFFNFTPTNLIYMLAVNGFDCKDAYMLKQFNDPYIHLAVYKSDIKPMNPKTTSWMDLIETGLLHTTVMSSIFANGHLRQEDIMYPWLDRENYYIDYVQQYTEIPVEAGDAIVDGIIDNVTFSDETLMEQSAPISAGTKLKSPLGIMRLPKKHQ